MVDAFLHYPSSEVVVVVVQICAVHRSRPSR